MAVLLLIPSLAAPATVLARTQDSSLPPPAFGIEGREVAAPPCSAACMTDHGPSRCDEPMWVYGSLGATRDTRTRSDIDSASAASPGAA